MPFTPLHPCNHPGCPRLTRDRYCEKCKALHPAWHKNTDYERMTGRKLQRERKRLFREQPLCAECMRQGRITAATKRDHIVPLAAGGLDIDDNIQGLCDACHDIKTQQESKAGQRGAKR